MESTIYVSLLLLLIAITMSMVGKGGGNFYVILMVFAGLSMHIAASTAQFIMIETVFSSMIVFNKSKKVD